MNNEELERIWETQVRKLLMLGVNDQIKLSEGTYRRKLPKFSSQPESYKGRFDIPLLVDPRVSLKALHKLIGLHSTIQEENIVDIAIVPDVPYAIWTHDGSRYRQHSVKDAIGHFQLDEIPSPLIEVLSLFIHYPQFFEGYGIDATGSIYGKESVPSVGSLFGKPELHVGEIEHPDARWGALSRGKQINVNLNP